MGCLAAATAPLLMGPDDPGCPECQSIWEGSLAADEILAHNDLVKDGFWYSTWVNVSAGSAEVISIDGPVSNFNCDSEGLCTFIADSNDYIDINVEAGGDGAEYALFLRED